MGFFKPQSKEAILPGGVNVNQRSSKFGGGTLYRGPLAFTEYKPGAATATTGVGDNAQRQALADLSQMGRTGFTETDAGQIQSAQRQADAGASSAQAGALQDAQRRGQSGGGMQFAASLAASQGSANRANESANQVAMQGAQNRAGANQALFQAGGQMEGQAIARGAATDAFNQWASGRESMANQQAFENATGQDKAAQEEEDAYWDRLGGLLS